MIFFKVGALVALSGCLPLFLPLVYISLQKTGCRGDNMIWVKDVLYIFYQLFHFLLDIEIPGIGSMYNIMIILWVLVFIGWCIHALIGSDIGGNSK